MKTFENTIAQWSETELALVRLLREKGADNPEAQKLLQDWVIKEEKQVETAIDYPTELIQSNLRRARLYFTAGFVDEAMESFEAARTQAFNERRDELLQEIMNEMEKI
ncbi:MAG: hypothetical protein V1902_03435 [Candidatus Falkowbacteria bacterium]